VCACALLALRQTRVQAAHELAEARLRVLQRDNELWRIRARIAERVTPERVQEVATRLNPLRPVNVEQDVAGGNARRAEASHTPTEAHP
jgi:hypothetical protein